MTIIRTMFNHNPSGGSSRRSSNSSNSSRTSCSSAGGAKRKLDDIIHTLTNGGGGNYGDESLLTTTTTMVDENVLKFEKDKLMSPPSLSPPVPTSKNDEENSLPQSLELKSLPQSVQSLLNSIDIDSNVIENSQKQPQPQKKQKTDHVNTFIITNSGDDDDDDGDGDEGQLRVEEEQEQEAEIPVETKIDNITSPSVSPSSSPSPSSSSTSSLSSPLSVSPIVVPQVSQRQQLQYSPLQTPPPPASLPQPCLTSLPLPLIPLSSLTLSSSSSSSSAAAAATVMHPSSIPPQVPLLDASTMKVTNVYRGLYPIKNVKPYFRKKTVNNQKLYICLWPECKFQTLKYSQHISRHIYLKHIGIKELRCEVANCAKVFKRPESLVQHVKNHICGFGIDPIRMKDNKNICGVKNIKQHFTKIMDNDIQVFMCQFDQCKFVTNNSGSIRRHVHNQHICPHSSPAAAAAAAASVSGVALSGGGDDDGMIVSNISNDLAQFVSGNVNHTEKNLVDVNNDDENNSSTAVAAAALISLQNLPNKSSPLSCSTSTMASISTLQSTMMSNGNIGQAQHPSSMMTMMNGTKFLVNSHQNNQNNTAPITLMASSTTALSPYQFPGNGSGTGNAICAEDNDSQSGPLNPLVLLTEYDEPYVPSNNNNNNVQTQQVQQNFFLPTHFVSQPSSAISTSTPSLSSSWQQELYRLPTPPPTSQQSLQSSLTTLDFGFIGNFDESLNTSTLTTTTTTSKGNNNTTTTDSDDDVPMDCSMSRRLTSSINERLSRIDEDDAEDEEEVKKMVNVNVNSDGNERNNDKKMIITNIDNGYHDNCDANHDVDDDEDDQLRHRHQSSTSMMMNYIDRMIPITVPGALETAVSDDDKQQQQHKQKLLLPHPSTLFGGNSSSGRDIEPIASVSGSTLSSSIISSHFPLLPSLPPPSQLLPSQQSSLPPFQSSSSSSSSILTSGIGGPIGNALQSFLQHGGTIDFGNGVGSDGSNSSLMVPTSATSDTPKNSNTTTSTTTTSGSSSSCNSNSTNQRRNNGLYSLKNYKDRYSKIRTNEGGTLFICRKCNFQAKSQITLIRHLWAEMGYKEFHCQFDGCTLTFDNEFSRYKHRKFDHDVPGQQQQQNSNNTDDQIVSSSLSSSFGNNSGTLPIIPVPVQTQSTSSLDTGSSIPGSMIIPSSMVLSTSHQALLNFSAANSGTGTVAAGGSNLSSTETPPLPPPPPPSASQSQPTLVSLTNSISTPTASTCITATTNAALISLLQASSPTLPTPAILTSNNKNIASSAVDNDDDRASLVSIASSSSSSSSSFSSSSSPSLSSSVHSILKGTIKNNIKETCVATLQQQQPSQFQQLINSSSLPMSTTTDSIKLSTNNTSTRSSTRSGIFSKCHYKDMYETIRTPNGEQHRCLLCENYSVRAPVTIMKHIRHHLSSELPQSINNNIGNTGNSIDPNHEMNFNAIIHNNDKPKFVSTQPLQSPQQQQQSSVTATATAAQPILNNLIVSMNQMDVAQILASIKSSSTTGDCSGNGNDRDCIYEMNIKQEKLDNKIGDDSSDNGNDRNQIIETNIKEEEPDNIIDEKSGSCIMHHQLLSLDATSSSTGTTTAATSNIGATTRKYNSRNKSGLYSLKRHENEYIRVKVDGKQMYKCANCDEYSTQSQASMVRHIWTHKRQSFICECGESFENEFSLYKHKKTSHPESTTVHNRTSSKKFVGESGAHNNSGGGNSGNKVNKQQQQQLATTSTSATMPIVASVNSGDGGNSLIMSRMIDNHQNTKNNSSNNSNVLNFVPYSISPQQQQQQQPQDNLQHSHPLLQQHTNPQQMEQFLTFLTTQRQQILQQLIMQQQQQQQQSANISDSKLLPPQSQSPIPSPPLLLPQQQSLFNIPLSNEQWKMILSVAYQQQLQQHFQQQLSPQNRIDETNFYSNQVMEVVDDNDDDDDDDDKIEKKIYEEDDCEDYNVVDDNEENEVMDKKSSNTFVTMSITGGGMSRRARAFKGSKANKPQHISRSSSTSLVDNSTSETNDTMSLIEDSATTTLAPAKVMNELGDENDLKSRKEKIDIKHTDSDDVEMGDDEITDD